MNQTPSDPVMNIEDRYIELLKDALTFALWDGQDGRIWRGRRWIGPLQRILGHRGLTLVKTTRAEVRERGGDWPRLAHTMVGAHRLNNLHSCVDRVLGDRIPGDLLETGVWRGGSCILMRGILAARGDTERRVWVADSFEGLPRPDPRSYPADSGDIHYKHDSLAVSLDEVRSNFEKYHLLDEQTRFLPGWFKETLPYAPIDKLALIRLDGDMYESTMDAIVSLYPKLSPGGFCIVDDYGAIDQCRQAVDDYRAAEGIDDRIIDIDGEGVYWRREQRGRATLH